MDDLQVDERLTIPAAELSWRFTTSGGPGGQHANRSNTRAELSYDIRASEVLDDDTRARLLRGLGERAPGGVVTVAAGESRSQWRNRQLARRRLRELLADALRVRKRRRPTRPSGSARRRRLEEKRRRGDVKRLRRDPDWD